MSEQWRGIERRLERLADCTSKLQALSQTPRARFDDDSLLRDIVERNFEIAAQCVIDVAMRVTSIEQARRTGDGATSIRRLAEIGVVDAAFAQSLAPLAGFRNVLAHEYTDVDWDIVVAGFGRLDDLRRFDREVRAWLASRSG